MSINTDIIEHFGNKLSSVDRHEYDLHGERAIKVIAHISDGRTVTGVFTKQQRAGFGGIEFSSKKDVVGLMIAKIESVLKGTAE